MFSQTESRTFQNPEYLVNEEKDSKTVLREGNFDNNILGFTYHDLQTLGAHRGQVYQYPDGYTAAVWPNASAPLNDPFSVVTGTIYNYKAPGSGQWLPTNGNASRIESMNSRFPSYAPYGENGEVIASQQTGGINIYTCPERGEGEWEHHLLEPTEGVPALKYPHLITSGPNHEYIHVAAVTDTIYNGQQSALLYFRSQDGGETWDKHNVILEGTGSGHYTAIHADNYCWAVQDNKLALVVSSPWIDLFYLESEDHGDSWEKHMVWEHPYPMFDFETTIIDERVWSPDGSLDAIYDETGRLHLAFGLTRVKHPQTGYDYVYYPWTDGIVHWNESLEPFEAYDQKVALSYDYLEVNETLVGWAVDTDSNNVFDYDEGSIIDSNPYLGLSSLPSLSYSQDKSTLYLSYVSADENRKIYDYHYRSPYIKACFYNPDDEAEWLWDATLEPYNTDVSPNTQQDFLYPQFTPVTCDTGYLFNIHHTRVGLYYVVGPYTSRVDIAGFTHSPNWPPNPLIETGKGSAPAKNKWQVAQNQPNPFSRQTQIEVELPHAVMIHLEVRNMSGKTVYSRQIRGRRGNNILTVPAKHLQAGVYLYTLTAAEETITRKMVVR